MSSTRWKFSLFIAATGLLTVFANGCGGGAAGTSTPDPAASTITSVAVTCTPTQIQVNQISQCSATVQGTGIFDPSVTWYADMGSINSSGLYTAPASAGTVTVKATSKQDSTKSGTAMVTVQAAPTITAVNASCDPTTVLVGQTSQCTATVQGTGNFDSSVTWSADIGSISSFGLFTALNTAGTATVKGTSRQDSTKFGTATITVQPPPAISSVSVSCSPSTIHVNQTSNCSAAVTGTGNFDPSVTWSADIGAVDVNGNYTAPTSAATATVKATSQADATKYASATIMVTASVSGGQTSCITTGPQYYATPSNYGSILGQAAPGATIHFAQGTYNIPDTGDAIRTALSGTASARICYISDVPWGARIIANSQGNSAVWSNSGDYVDIQGFEMTGASINNLGIYQTGNNVRIIGNHIYGIQSPDSTNGGAGILNGGLNDDVIGNYVHDIGPASPTRRVHGIYVLGAGGSVVNNIVFHASAWGIHLWHDASNIVVSSNTVFSNYNGGILIGAGECYASSTCVDDNTTVANNIVYQNGLASGANGNGIEEYGGTGPNNRYLNNLVYQNGPSNWSLLTGSQSGTVAADPQFLNYTGDGTGDYHLQSSSPAIDTGTSIDAPSTDFDGVARPQGSGYDIGAYEHKAATTAVSISPSSASLQPGAPSSSLPR